ncbi:cytochrome P450 oxidoreductase [Plenodomus tracheiphilus IPT5]|uniref:Cytochrome P450 oxidoreductase n=1 Tax=Plenodomus tracheiphilus IPT5 TaxID=1408161 RepID=A0A6A7AW79_9PLEO|nr:cytochrome P450 oxidoreductase [Plenodomus tracheiphilus IPT5]
MPDTNNFTISRALHEFIARTQSPIPQEFWSLLICAVIFALISRRCILYFTSELPPFGSGLKQLPGPRSTLPYIGRVHDVDRMHPWTAMHRFSKEYDGLFALTLGGETHIWIAREDVAQDLLCKHASISSSRADLGAYPNVTQGHKYLPLLGYTDTFLRQRKFAHIMMTQNIRDKYHGYLGLEVKRLMHELLAQPKDFYDLTYLFCARVSARLAYGSVNSAPDHVANANAFIHQLGPSGPKTNLIPFLRYFPEWLVPDKRSVRLRQEKEAIIWTQLFEKTKGLNTTGDQTKSYVSASLCAKDRGENDLLFSNEDEAIYAVGMLCIVGIFTIAGPAILFIMAMVLHPDWQTKVRAEVDKVVGEELLDLKHCPDLPLLRAAIKECIRWKSTVPLGVPRLLTDNYVFDGFHFPKGAVVHILDIAMSQDTQRYDDPSTYNPGRWVDPSSPNFKEPLSQYPRLKGHHIFGRGKRACPGQDLAEAELFVFCGNLIKFFEVGVVLDGEGRAKHPDPERWTTDVIGGPLPFECDVRARDERRGEMVEEMFRKAFA